MAFMVPLVKNHYDIYNRQASPLDHEGSLYLSATSLDSIKSIKAAAAAKKAARTAAAKINASETTKSAKSNNNRKILIKVSTRPPAKSKSGTGRVQSASISLPIARNESGKPVLQIKKAAKVVNGNRERKSANGELGGPLVTRPMPHIKRTLRNPYTNRVYSYSVSIPNYVAEEDEAELREYEKDDNEIESANGTPGNSLESVLLYSSSAPTSTSNLKERLSSGSSSEEEEYASNLSSPICPDSPTHECMAAGVMNCSATSLVYAYEAITAELNLPSTTAPMAVMNAKSKVLRSVSSPPDAPETAGHNKQSQEQAAEQDEGKPLNDKRQSSGNAREYIELLRKFIVHLKLLKLGSSKKLFSSNKSNNMNANSNNNRSNSERRPRKDTMDDSKHL